MSWIRCLYVERAACPSLMLHRPNASNMILVGLRWDFWGSKSTRNNIVAGKGVAQQNPRLREAYLVVEFSVTPWLGLVTTSPCYDSWRQALCMEPSSAT